MTLPSRFHVMCMKTCLCLQSPIQKTESRVPSVQLFVYEEWLVQTVASKLQYWTSTFTCTVRELILTDVYKLLNILIIDISNCWWTQSFLNDLLSENWLRMCVIFMKTCWCFNRQSADSCLSMRSDWSKQSPPNFGIEPRPSHAQ